LRDKAVESAARDAQLIDVPRTVYSIGHSTHAADAFAELLRRHEVEVVADVRRFPGSRRNPQFNPEALADSLGAAGIRLEPLGESLGGRRQARAGSPNGGWRVEGFRAYADHMASEEFAAGLAALESLAADATAALMCAEADWHRCHRRLIADALVVRDWRVLHIGPGGELSEHGLTSFALVEGERITYPAAQQQLG
jgi:uncharacterized protein (DUF488 family)